MTNNILPSEILSLSMQKDINTAEHKLIKNSLSSLLTISEDYYKSGKKGLYYLPFKIRISIALAANIYREIGVIIKDNSFNWYSGRQYTSLLVKIKITIFTIVYEIINFKKILPVHDNKLHFPFKDIFK